MFGTLSLLCEGKPSERVRREDNMGEEPEEDPKPVDTLPSEVGVGDISLDDPPLEMEYDLAEWERNE